MYRWQKKWGKNKLLIILQAEETVWKDARLKKVILLFSTYTKNDYKMYHVLESIDDCVKIAPQYYPMTKAISQVACN